MNLRAELYIDRKWVSSDREVVPIVNPYSGSGEEAKRLNDASVLLLTIQPTSVSLDKGFTNRMDLAYKVAHKLEVGGVLINGTSNFRLDHWPYGGVKQSGIGREGPRYAIEDMTETKMIVMKFSRYQ
ncbi:Aldehyde dehydrogenase family protein [Thermoflavimicrobium dichotomicum]|uniref:Aldehyde dehydrogenase family protein n=1 Tax=Thermoflavimicrobium dichotomicum TaxID=46223 RepID=A0A1I3L2Q5_9BACL|nr:Aldehyde dehydrogenase family protein [Thermoflavimicrobium dichotomicum]